MLVFTTFGTFFVLPIVSGTTSTFSILVFTILFDTFLTSPLSIYTFSYFFGAIVSSFFVGFAVDESILVLTILPLVVILPGLVVSYPFVVFIV